MIIFDGQLILNISHVHQNDPTSNTAKLFHPKDGKSVKIGKSQINRYLPKDADMSLYRPDNVLLISGGLPDEAKKSIKMIKPIKWEIPKSGKMGCFWYSPCGLVCVTPCTCEKYF